MFDWTAGTNIANLHSLTGEASSNWIGGASCVLVRDWLVSCSPPESVLLSVFQQFMIITRRRPLVGCLAADVFQALMHEVRRRGGTSKVLDGDGLEKFLRVAHRLHRVLHRAALLLLLLLLLLHGEESRGEHGR